MYISMKDATFRYDFTNSSKFLIFFHHFQDVSILRNKVFSLTDTLSTVEIELRTCRDQLEKVIAERDSLKRQTTSYLLELDRLKQVTRLI